MQNDSEMPPTSEGTGAHPFTDVSQSPIAPTDDPSWPREDFDGLEISDLPPTQRSHYLLLKITRLRARLAGGRAVRTRRKPAQPAGQRAASTLAAGALLLFLLALLVSGVPPLRTRLQGLFGPTPSPTGIFSQIAINNQIIIIQRRSSAASIDTTGLEPTPTHCPAISPLLHFSTPTDPPGVGAGSVWVSGFAGPFAALDNLEPTLLNGHLTWYETLTIFMQRGLSGALTLQGSDQNSHEPILLGKADLSILSQEQTFNLNDNGHYLVNGAWEMTALTLTVPAAGCYSLHASWAGHAWTNYFAAGS